MTALFSTTRRDYNADLPEPGRFIVDTRPGTAPGNTLAVAVITLDDGNGTVEYVTLTKEGARDVGVTLIQWTGSPLTEGDYVWNGDNEFVHMMSTRPLSVLCSDGVFNVELGEVSFSPSDEQVIDIATRLIVAAGVAE